MRHFQLALLFQNSFYHCMCAYEKIWEKAIYLYSCCFPEVWKRISKNIQNFLETKKPKGIFPAFFSSSRAHKLQIYLVIPSRVRLSPQPLMLVCAQRNELIQCQGPGGGKKRNSEKKRYVYRVLEMVTLLFLGTQIRKDLSYMVKRSSN